MTYLQIKEQVLSICDELNRIEPNPDSQDIEYWQHRLWILRNIRLQKMMDDMHKKMCWCVRD